MFCRLCRLHALGGLKLKEVFPPPGTPIYLKDQVKTSLLGVNIDYDTYMKNRRPGSLVPEEVRHCSSQCPIKIKLQKKPQQNLKNHVNLMG